jgi:hypothetical protein
MEVGFGFGYGLGLGLGLQRCCGTAAGDEFAMVAAALQLPPACLLCG